MSIAELAKVIGKAGLWDAGNGITVDVKVEDVRTAYGHIQFLVVPLSGRGGAWVGGQNVTMRDVSF